MPTLHWLDRETAVKAAEAVPFRVLDFDPQLSVGDPAAENLVIQGDNLDAVKAVMPYFAGRVKCIAIDPPYNTRSAFEHYDDNLEHSTWLSMMYPRLELMRELLTEDGTIWVAIDDSEGHYLKVLMDEILGRSNFVANIVWEKADSPRNSARQFSTDHDHILVYSRRSEWTPRKLPRTEESDFIYSNPDDDERGVWLPGDPYANKPYSKGQYSMTGPTGRVFTPPPGRFWRVSEAKLRQLDADGRIWWGPKGDARPSIKRYLSEVSDLVPRTLWKKDQVGSNRTSKNEMRALFPNEASFGTPKPERLIERILTISTNPGDIVCDPFLGSGTTAAVAHKMGRRYIGIEMGEHAVTHCVPRLKKVIEGEQGGISTLVNWQGGGGFRFARLGPPIFTADGAIHPDIRFPTLAAHIWFSETRTAWPGKGESPFLGIHNGKAYYLLFNGILGDKCPLAGNVLNGVTFRHLPPHAGPKIVYGEVCQWGTDRLRCANIEFRKIPHGLKVR